MKKFQKKPVVIKAEKWSRLGDVEEASIVRHSTDHVICLVCGRPIFSHGSCPTLEGFHIVCPGDWIIKGVKSEYYPCKPDIFEMTYERVYERVE